MPTKISEASNRNVVHLDGHEQRAAIKIAAMNGHKTPAAWLAQIARREIAACTVRKGSYRVTTNVPAGIRVS